MVLEQWLIISEDQIAGNVATQRSFYRQVDEERRLAYVGIITGF